MKIKPRKAAGMLEADLTPMIDVTFQLIAFFMVLINFTQAEQMEKVMLPDSVLAKPPDTKPDFPITLNLESNGAVTIAGQSVNAVSGEKPYVNLKPYLKREINDAKGRVPPVSPGEILVIIRSDKNAPTGRVQQLIAICQEPDVGLESFALRVKERLE